MAWRMLSFELVVVLFLVVINGILAMSELALVSARRTRLQADVQRGDLRARAALNLLENPNTLLATTQLGVTLIGILAGVFGGASLADDVAQLLQHIPLLTPISSYLAFFLVVVLITYLSLLIGELVPKRIALSHPEEIAKATVPLIKALAFICRPAIWFLDRSTEAVVKPLSLRPSGESDVSEEDIKSMVTEGTRAGVIEDGEREIIQRVFRLGDRPVASLMTPRSQVTFLYWDSPIATLLTTALDAGFTWFPVIRTSSPEVMGLVSIHDLARFREQGLVSPPSDWELVAPLRVPESTSALRLLELFRRERARFSLVVDEYGELAGIATVHDVVEAIVGELGESWEEALDITTRSDGSLLVDAGIDIEELFQHLHLSVPSVFDDRDYHSLGGFVLKNLGHIPKAGEFFEACGLRFEVVDMDRYRIDKVLISRIAGEAKQEHPSRDDEPL